MAELFAVNPEKYYIETRRPAALSDRCPHAAREYTEIFHIHHHI